MHMCCSHLKMKRHKVSRWEEPGEGKNWRILYDVFKWISSKASEPVTDQSISPGSAIFSTYFIYAD